MVLPKGRTMKKHEDFLYQEIAEALRRRIASGELKPGDRVPPVREMARQWGCTPGTVSRAYAQLRQEGLLAGHRGSGTRVTPSELQPNDPSWGWASLVNRAEQYLLEAISGGHSPGRAESALAVAISRWQDLQRTGAPSSSSESPSSAKALHFVGSHDLSVELLARMLRDEPPHLQLSIDYVGSLGGLMALAREQADVAGSHLWDEATDTYNLPFVQRLLPGRRAVLLTLAHRSLGLITPPGNPGALRGLGDLTRSDTRLVNRQPGSGTRVWLDAHLKALGLSPASVPGYEREELTHLAVARAVDQGEATVGLGIHAAAAAFGLDCVPLTQERYDLVFPEGVWNMAQAQTLVKVVRSARFAQALADLSGYDTAQTGQEKWVS
jgi:molybdate-binding protein/DNA-binding transcriptional regulator YhcF (GntR family)